MSSQRWTWGLIVCCLAASLRGDALVLSGGQRIEGRIIGGTGNDVRIRRTDSAGRSYVEIVDRAKIVKIERDPRPADASTTRPEPVRPPTAVRPTATSRPESPSQMVELAPDMQRALIVAIAKWRAEDFGGAGRDLSRLVNSASAAEREVMSATAQAATGKTLAELAADAHLQGAVASRRGAAIRLPYVTEYEKPALVPMLIVAYEATLIDRTEQLKVRTSPPSDDEPSAKPTVAPVRTASSSAQPWYEAYPHTQPASAPAASTERKRFAVADWLDRPEAFDGTVEQAEALLPRAYQAISLLNERIRLDPALRRNADLKRRLLADKQRLTALAKALSDYSEEPAADPEAEAAEKARREEYQKLWLKQQEEEAKRLQQIREAAQKWQEEQAKPKKGLFDWLKPADKDKATEPALPAAAPASPQATPTPAPAPAPPANPE